LGEVVGEVVGGVMVAEKEKREIGIVQIQWYY
jgi:hypothetical protein